MYEDDEEFLNRLALFDKMEMSIFLYSIFYILYIIYIL
jgi:hypothetical protein